MFAKILSSRIKNSKSLGFCFPLRHFCPFARAILAKQRQHIHIFTNFHPRSLSAFQPPRGSSCSNLGDPWAAGSCPSTSWRLLLASVPMLGVAPGHEETHWSLVVFSLFWRCQMLKNWHNANVGESYCIWVFFVLVFPFWFGTRLGKFEQQLRSLLLSGCS